MAVFVGTKLVNIGVHRAVLSK